MLRALLEWRMLVPYLGVKELGRLQVAAPGAAAELRRDEWWAVLRREYGFVSLRRHRGSCSLVRPGRVVAWEDDLLVPQLCAFLSLGD